MVMRINNSIYTKGLEWDLEHNCYHPGYIGGHRARATADKMGPKADRDIAASTLSCRVSESFPEPWQAPGPRWAGCLLAPRSLRAV